MAENKRSFLLYCDIAPMVKKLPDDKAGELFKLILSYVNDENPDIDSVDYILQIAFEPIRQSLKRDLQKYRNIVERNRTNGAKGGRPKKTKNNPKNPVGYFGNPRKPKKADNDNDNDSDNIIDNDSKNIESRKKIFALSLNPFVEKYDKEMIRDFYEYWTEHGLNDRKMRFEKEKTFGLSRRLSTWNKNKYKFENEKNRKNNRSCFESDSTQRTIDSIKNRIEQQV